MKHFIAALAIVFALATAAAAQPLRVAYSDDVTTSTAPNLTITKTAPLASGVLFSNARIIPYIGGDENQTATVTVYRWIPSDRLATDDTNWIPVLQGIYTVTASSRTGAADTLVPAAKRFVDTIAVSSSSSDGTELITSNAANQIAELRIPLDGAAAIEVRLAVGSATNVNALVGPYRRGD